MLEKLLGSANRVFSLEETPNHSGEMEDRYLTDQQRIIRLLSENDGKMWQRTLIDETGWSPSKMSRRLSEMEEKGLIVRKPIGRENSSPSQNRQPASKVIAVANQLPVVSFLSDRVSILAR